MPYTSSGLWVPWVSNKKGADRPHWITVTLGLFAPAIGLAALLISFQSFRVSNQALDVSQQSLRVGQRAYLSVRSVDVTSASRNTNSEADIHIVLNNSGNTPAYIRTGALELLACNVSDFQHFGDTAQSVVAVPVINPPMDVGPKEQLTMNTEWGPRLFSSLSENIMVGAQLSYTDVFQQSHIIEWGWGMNRFRVTESLHPYFPRMLFLSFKMKEAREQLEKATRKLGDLRKR